MNWLNENAGAIQVISTMVQVAATIVLVVITVGYAKSTKTIASETHDMTHATEELTELTRKQQLDNTRPAIGFRFEDWPNARNFGVVISNIGVGPALDVQVSIVNSPLNLHMLKAPVFPMAIPVLDVVTTRFWLHETVPFTDESLPRWPRNEEDRELIRQDAERPQGGSAGQSIKRQVAADLARIKNEFDAEVKRSVSSLQSLGTLQATYRDIHGRLMSTEAEILSTTNVPAHEEAGSDDAPRFLTFGPSSLRQDQ